MGETCKKGILLANITDAVLENINVTGIEGSLLNIVNVSVKGLNNAVLTEFPQLSDPIKEAAPYTLK